MIQTDIDFSIFDKQKQFLTADNELLFYLKQLKCFHQISLAAYLHL